MKKFRKVWAVGLSVCMGLGLLSSCGNSEKVSGTASNTDTETVSSTASEDTKQSSADTDNSDGEYSVGWEDMAEIIVVYPSMSSIPSGLSVVEDAINEITETEINTHVTLTMFEAGSYEQQVNLMITSNETIDLAVTWPSGSVSFSTMASQNQLTDITAALEEYAPKMSEVIGALMGSTTVDGKVLAVPAYKNFASGTYIEMRTDVLEDLGLLEKAQNMTSFTEYEEILEAVKNSEKWGELSGIVSVDGTSVLPRSTTYAYSDNFADTQYIDNLGNTQRCIGVVYGETDPQVFNAFASEAYRNNYEMVKRWYDAGYVYTDIAATQTGNELIKSGAAFSTINSMGVGAEAAASFQCGRDMTCVLVASAPITSGSCTSFTWCVPMTSQEPEAAVAFLEMMFNDARIADLFSRGIEGVDYYVDDEGVAHYVEGNENPAYHSESWLNVNKFAVTPWEGETLENWKGQEDYMKSAAVSDYMGFAPDTTSLTNEISAINTVIDEYTSQIQCGVADADVFDAFLAKLEVSGMDKLVSFYQEQLNMWMAQ